MSDLAEIMKKEIKTIDAGKSLIMAARQMRDDRIGSLLVKANGEYVGVITETDIVRKAAAEGKDLSSLTVEAVMTKPVVSIESTKTVREANDLMGECGIRHLAVSEAGKIVGIVSVRDILLAFKSYAEPTYSEPKIAQD
ncbi:MAG: histidine kinase [Nitrospirales bacterium]|nr:MAG: histidine kinase [Nitrospirales bacterium]